MVARTSFVTAIALALALVSSRALALPEITAPVTDTAHVVSPDAVSTLSARLRSVYESGGPQIAVVFVDDAEGTAIEDFSIRVAQRWHGGRAGRNDGVLITFAIQDHRSRIEVGSGLESAIPDARATEILDSLRPTLQEEQYGLAGWLAADQLAAVDHSRGHAERARRFRVLREHDRVVRALVRARVPREAAARARYPRGYVRRCEHDGFFVEQFEQRFVLGRRRGLRRRRGELELVSVIR